jgi:hypothetical protein
MKTGGNFIIFVLMVMFIGIVFLPAFQPPGLEVKFPGDGFAKGWKKKGQPREFNRNGLYGHINGGSELFLEFGFERLRLQKYHNQYSNEENDEISIEVYRMESPEAALGIYLMKCGNETPLPGIEEEVRNTGDHYQILLIKGHCFIKVNNFSGKSSRQPVMVALANQTLEQLPAVKPRNVFSLLPEENRVAGSEMLIRGLYSLQAIYTLGEGDMLLLKNKIFGVTAQYQYTSAEHDANNHTYNRLIVQYPGENDAQHAYSHVRANLDSYIEVIEDGKQHFFFKDYQGKFGKVSLKGNILDILFNSLKLKK